MYVWGGGWNKADTAAGKEARQIGLSPRWKKFYEKQDASYDVSQTAYQIHDGLDCSGFVGWVTYNTMETKDGQPGYVKESGKQIQWFEKKGFGKVIQADAITTYHPGDLMANQDHIFIVLGQYKDGSLSKTTLDGIRNAICHSFVSLTEKGDLILDDRASLDKKVHSTMLDKGFCNRLEVGKTSKKLLSLHMDVIRQQQKFVHKLLNSNNY